MIDSSLSFGVIDIRRGNVLAISLFIIFIKQIGSLHPRNAFQGYYDMPKLVAACPALGPHVIPAHRSKGGRDTIDFADPTAVRALNKALLAADYGIAWDLPDGRLCPPVPGRADYVHHIADLLAESAGTGTIPTGPEIRGLDVGTGASLIYPLIGAAAYGWSFLASECDAAALAAEISAVAIVHQREDAAADRNPRLARMAGLFPGGAVGPDLGRLLDVEGLAGLVGL